MYKLLRTEDFNTYIIRHFQCDSDSDLATILSDYATVEIPKNALHAGWTAVVLGSGSDVSKPYILDNALTGWAEIIPFPQIAALEEKVDRLEGKTTRLLYSGSTTPTASDINTFVTGLGYTSPFEGIAVVVAGTYHIWHYYENDNIGWRDDGLDTITPFTNSVAGSILGSSDDGKISANNDGTGSVNGWSNKLDKQTGVTTYKQAYVKDKNGTQEMVDINPTGSDAIENLLARYYTSGRLRVGDPVDNKDAVHKKYVDDGFIAKQTGETTYPKVYGKDADGSQSLVEYSSTVRNAALVQRSGLGQVAVPDTPTDNSHATSKIYVDNKLTATLTQLQDGTYSLTFGV